MMGKSHLLIGLGVGLVLATALHSDPLHIAAMTVAAGAGAMLPDIDHRHAPIRQKLGLLGDVLLFWLPHRGLTHSLLVLAIVTGLAVFFWQTFGIALAAGYASHLIADMTTQHGLPILYPWEANFYVLPRGFRVTTGKLSEGFALLLILGSMGLMFARLSGFIH